MDCLVVRRHTTIDNVGRIIQIAGPRFCWACPTIWQKMTSRKCLQRRVRAGLQNSAAVYRRGQSFALYNQSNENANDTLCSDHLGGINTQIPSAVLQ